MSTTRSPNTTQPSPSTSLTTETSLSLLYRVLRTVIRPLRPRLVKPGRPLPAGSPRLTNHPETKNKCAILERQDQDTGLWLYDFIPGSRPVTKLSSSSSPHGHREHPRCRVLYFAGGGFQSPPANEHWAFVSQMASDSRLADVLDFTLVSYPLAPNSPACASLPVLQKLLRAECLHAAKSGRKITVMGDSAGGNIALSLGLWWADEVSRRQHGDLSSDGDDGVNGIHSDAAGATGGTGGVGDDDEATITSDMPPNKTKLDNNSGSSSSPIPTPTALENVLSDIIVISPAADLRNTNPSIQHVDRLDPLLSFALIDQTATAWTQPPPQTQGNASELQPSEPHLISPVLASIDTLTHAKRNGIHIHGVIGTHDVLAPDAEVFRQMCVGVDVPGQWLVWKGQMHCFVLAGVYGMKEGKRGIRWIVDLLAKRNI